MATTTTNLGLTKPAAGDYYDIGVFNENFQKVDDAFGAVDSALNTVDEALDDKQNVISVLGLLKQLADGSIVTAEANSDYYEPPLRSTNISVATGSWAADTTYADYSYRAAVPVTGALATMTPEVVFALADAVSGILAPVAEAYAGGVYIYASEVPAAAVTIATLTLWKAVD